MMADDQNFVIVDNSNLPSCGVVARHEQVITDDCSPGPLQNLTSGAPVCTMDFTGVTLPLNVGQCAVPRTTGAVSCNLGSEVRSEISHEPSGFGINK